MAKAKAIDKLEKIEWIRAICCLLVIIIHVTAEFWFSFLQGSMQYKFNILLNTLSQFAVPCFIFISGFVLYYAYYGREYSYLNFYKKRIWKTVVPYLAWSIIYIFASSIFHNAPINMVSTVKALIIGGASHHLYFIPLIIQFYLIFPFLSRFYQRLNNKTLLISIFLAINIIVAFYIVMPYKDRFFMNYLLYFGLGFLLADLEIKGFVSSKAYRIVLFSLYLIFTSYYFVERYRATAGLELISRGIYKYGWQIFSLISIISIYEIANILNARKPSYVNNKIIKSISKHSFTMYLSHMFFIRLLTMSKIFNEIKNFSMTLALVLELIAIVCASWVLGIVVDKIKQMVNFNTKVKKLS